MWSRKLLYTSPKFYIQLPSQKLINPMNVTDECGTQKCLVCVIFENPLSAKDIEHPHYKSDTEWFISLSFKRLCLLACFCLKQLSAALRKIYCKWSLLVFQLQSLVQEVRCDDSDDFFPSTTFGCLCLVTGFPTFQSVVSQISHKRAVCS